MRLRIVSACDAVWAAMERAPGGRHCGACDRMVHDLRLATSREARLRSMLAGDDRFCARVRAGSNGEALFRAEPAPRRAPAPWLAAVVGALGAACGGSPAQPDARAPHAVASLEPPRDAPAPLPSVAHDAAKDTDGDGVADDEDACPTEAAPSADGCPRIVVEQQGIVVVEHVEFSPRSSAVGAASMPMLREIAEVMREHAEISLVHVIGHTDASEPSAPALGRARADAVVAELVKLGVAPQRLVAESQGAAMPLQPNDTVEHRAQNRRVEFRAEPRP